MNYNKIINNREDDGPYWFLEWILEACLFILIIELAVGKLPSGRYQIDYENIEDSGLRFKIS